ncbi:MAG: rhomboid family intramembrane serine protease [Bacilli bacterium]|nr:rhomboid family intramembrane serine protease [Bacilli bacterium]
MDLSVRKEDQILMSLVHYFVTKENYSPIYVHGVKDEIWLEKLDGPYRVIRINSNRIINKEQFEFDQYKIKDILKQIKKKTLSLSINALNINLNEDDNLKDEEGLKNIDSIIVKDLDDIEKNEMVLEVFPNIKNNLIKDTNGLELIFNVTKDINEKTSNENKRFEKIFADKKILITYIIMTLCIIYFLVVGILGRTFSSTSVLVRFGANNVLLLKSGQVWRLITYAFIHAGIIHLLCNMYSLYIIGPQVESKFGKVRFILIYLISAISGGLLSAGITNYVSVGASGAIFGVLGALLYFGMRFRLYLKESIKSQILPVIIINIGIGFMISGIDNACHIGGLIGGFLAAMALGIPDDERNNDHINGTIMLLIFLAFLCYLVFFR